MNDWMKADLTADGYTLEFDPAEHGKIAVRVWDKDGKKVYANVHSSERVALRKAYHRIMERQTRAKLDQKRKEMFR